MSLRPYCTFQALVLALLAIYLLERIGDGRILRYINRRYVFLAMGAAVLLMVVAQAVLRSRGEGKTYPPGPLPLREGGINLHESPSTREGGINLHESLSSRDEGEEEEHEHAGEGRKGRVPWLMALPQQRSVLDWIRVFSTAKDPAEFDGQPADVTGFVYHDIRLGKGEFMAGRFSVTCCVPDAIAIGTLVQWPASASLPDNRWVRVRGSMEVSEVDGQKVPMIRAASVETVPEPEQPYIFP